VELATDIQTLTDSGIYSTMEMKQGALRPEFRSLE
jgi:hypothetical protein